MKKLYISCPMSGRTSENIKRSREMMQKMAELYWGEDLEVIDSVIDYIPPGTKNERIWCLGQSVSKMAEADYYIGVETYDYCGCAVENNVAYKYDIPRKFISIRHMSDLFDEVLETTE